MNTRILIFGDSITWGSFDEEGGWASRIKKYTDEKRVNTDYDASVYILGISGDTTEDLLKRFENETRARLHKDRTLQIIFAIGLNDTQITLQDHHNIVSLDIFKKNIDLLINLAQKYTNDIIFVGLTPVDERKVNPLDRKPTHAFLNIEVSKYNNALKEITKENNVEFIDINTILQSLSYEDILFDGLHPNRVGHEKIFKIVLNFLQTKYEI